MLSRNVRSDEAGVEASSDMSTRVEQFAAPHEPGPMMFFRSGAVGIMPADVLTKSGSSNVLRIRAKRIADSRLSDEQHLRWRASGFSRSVDGFGRQRKDSGQPLKDAFFNFPDATRN